MRKLNMVVNTLDKKAHINREIYGHFSEHLGACIYDGIYVGENSKIPNTNGVRNDVIAAFKELKMPVLRWPGGCFADDYHWLDGVGKKSERPKRINAYWGGVTEPNSFGTHEFFNLCEKIGCEPYLAGNLGSGTPKELSDWIEYITFDGDSNMTELRKKNGREKPWKLKYIGIGNENWGGGGAMRPEYYTDEYRKFQAYARNLGGSHLFKVACGPSADDYRWTEKLMENLNDTMVDALSLHYYTVPTGDWEHKGSSTKFSDAEYYGTISRTLQIEDMIRKHGAIIRKYTDKVKLIVDEWGCWYDVEEGTNPGFLYQQNTMRDAIVAACNLNIFNNNADIVCMANLAQAVNVLQALLLTKGEKMIKTPTYHVMNMFKTHQDSENVYSFIENEKVGEGGEEIPALSYSASVSQNGHLNITIANCSLTDEYEISCRVIGATASAATGEILTGNVHDKNDFDAPTNVIPKVFGTEIKDNIISLTIPKCSVISLVVGFSGFNY
jgi:alpha-N-arabinofuranosidase